MKINRLEIENVKRVRAVKMEPKKDGLTIIGGRNAQGKTSVLDAIAWALGGERYRPDAPTREGSVIPPMLKVVLDNGIIVERKGKNSDLTVTDPKGEKAGQTLLDAFVEKLALDLPKFMTANDTDKANILLRIIGVEERLKRLRLEETTIYNQRRAVGQIADQKRKFAREMPEYPDAPKEPVSAMSLIQQQQSILARNGENQRQRQRKADLERYGQSLVSESNLIREKIKALETELAKKVSALHEVEDQLEAANKTVEQLQDENTAEIEESLMKIESINVKVRANLDRDKAEEDAKEHEAQYNKLSAELDKTRDDITALLKGAALPLPDLGINANNELTYRGHTWGDMSGAEQLKVATAIVRRLNPECGFVLIDRMEAFDPDELAAFGAWLEQEGLQAICTRVSTGAECTLIIEDGAAIGQAIPKYTEGEF